MPSKVVVLGLDRSELNILGGFLNWTFYFEIIIDGHVVVRSEREPMSTLSPMGTPVEL